MFKFLTRRKYREYLTGTKIAGHTFWTFKTVAALPGERRVQFQAAVAMAELGVSRSDIKACIKLIEESAKNNDMLKVIKVTNVLDNYTDLYASERVLFEMANQFILLDNEDIIKSDERTTEIKRKLYDTNINVKAFFLNSLTSSLKDIQLLSKEIDLMEYTNLKEVKQIEAAFLKLMRESS